MTSRGGRVHGRRLLPPISIVLALLIALSACSSSSDPRGSDDGSSRAPAPPDRAASPADLADNLTSRVSAGDWTMEEGLLATLDHLTLGSDRPDITQGAELPSSEATSFLLLAQEYLATAEPGPTTDQIQAAYDRVVPSAEVLFALAGQAPRPRHGTRARQDPEPTDCATLWARLDQSDDVAPRGDCLQVDTLEVQGVTVNVFYPTFDPPAGMTQSEFVARTSDAVRRSISVLAPIGRMPGAVDIVITGENWSNFFATAEYERDVTRCGIVLYGLATEQPTSIFLETVAHELAHCLQFFELGQKMRQLGTRVPHKWWLEGSADYFGTLAIPESWADFAFYIDALRENERNRTLFDLTYENFAFFWSVHNDIGPDGVVGLLHTIPPGSNDQQRTALQALTGFDHLFHTYGERFSTDTIVRSDGAPIPIGPEPTLRWQFDSTGSEQLDPTPFVIHRIERRVPAGHRARFEMTAPDGVLATAHVNGFWGAVDLDVCAAEDDYTDLIIVTSTSARGAAQEFALEATELIELDPEDPTSCRPCPVGRWRRDSLDGMNVPDETEGTFVMEVEFSDDGSMRADGRIQLTSGDGDQRTEVEATGSGTGTYTVEGDILTTTDSNFELRGTARVYFRGELMGEFPLPSSAELGGGADPQGIASAGQFRIACDDDSFSYIPVGGDTVFTYDAVE